MTHAIEDKLKELELIITILATLGANIRIANIYERGTVILSITLQNVTMSDQGRLVMRERP